MAILENEILLRHGIRALYSLL